jgi:hypothetical protein
MVNAKPPQLYACIGGRLGWLEQVQKILSPPEFDPQTVQPVASRYNTCIIPVKILVNNKR